MADTRYFLVQDNDCHWFVIPVSKMEAWDAFLEIDPDDERSWDVPDFAIPVDGPHRVSFRDWSEE